MYVCMPLILSAVLYIHAICIICVLRIWTFRGVLPAVVVVSQKEGEPSISVLCVVTDEHRACFVAVAAVVAVDCSFLEIVELL